MLEVVPRPWTGDALCIEHPEVTFFPIQGQSVKPAKAICRRCLVRDECRAWALDTKVEYGVWGGLSARERRIMLEARRPIDDGDQ